MELSEDVRVEAALLFLDELIYPSDSYQSDPHRLAGAEQLSCDDLYMLITLGRERFDWGGLGGTGTVRALCAGTVGGPDEVSKRIRTLYRVRALCREASLGVGAASRTLEELTGTGEFPDWDDEEQRRRAEPLLAFALASVAHPPREEIVRTVRGWLKYTDPLLRETVAAHPDEIDLMVRLFFTEGMRAAQLREVLDGSAPLSEGAL